MAIIFILIILNYFCLTIMMMMNYWKLYGNKKEEKKVWSSLVMWSNMEPKLNKEVLTFNTRGIPNVNRGFAKGEYKTNKKICTIDEQRLLIFLWLFLCAFVFACIFLCLWFSLCVHVFNCIIVKVYVCLFVYLSQWISFCVQMSLWK